MGIFDLFKDNENKKTPSSTYESLEYTRACINCMAAVSDRYIYIWENFSSFISKYDIYCREYYAAINLKKELAENQVQCESCRKVGMFDIWDIELNGQALYSPPKNDTPQTQFFFTKENGQIRAEYRPFVGGTHPTNLTMFKVAKTILGAVPRSQFKAFDNGFVDIIAYQKDNLDCAPNRCRFAGFSYNEATDLINQIENNYRTQYNIDW